MKSSALLFLPLLLLATCATIVSGADAASTKKKPTSATSPGGSGGTLLSNVKENLSDTAKKVDQVIHKSAIAGKIVPVIQKLCVSKQKAKLIWTNVRSQTQLVDLILILWVGWATVPMMRYPYDMLVVADADEEAAARSTTTEKRQTKPFKDTVLFHVANNLSQLAKLALLVYLVDVLLIALSSMSFPLSSHKLNVNLSNVFAQIVYTVWAAARLIVLKRYLIRRAIQCSEEKMGRANILDHLLDAVIYGITVFFLLDVLPVEIGLTVKSMFAFGSAGTLVLSWASKDLASQLINGLALSASDKLYEGEYVRFGDGTLSGSIVKMGWMETVLRGSDESILAIPNSQLANQRLTNLSRVYKCQVMQTLRFHHEDVDKLPALLEDIKAEIKADCPALITNGSRPFRAYWKDYQPDCLEVMVQCHFDLKPLGDAYWENRQRVLQAIGRAIKKNNLELAVSSTKPSK